MKMSRSATVAGALTVLFAATPVSAACVGDCDGDGAVSVNELIIGVHIALGSEPVAR